MENELEAVSKLIDTVVEFGVSYGFQILGALVFLLIGLKVAGWTGRKVATLTEAKEVDPALARFIGNITKLIVIGFVIIITLGNFGISIAPLIALAGGIVGGLGLPRWFIMLARGRRMKKFTSEFANSIDVIVRGIKTGLPLNECLKIIANEAPEPICTEFHELVESQTLGVTLEDALKRMYQRMPLQEVNFFAVVLAIQQKTGGNLAEALSNLSGVLRSRKLMREKIAALSSEAKASALIIGSLPPGVMAMVYVTTPDYMSLMFTDNLGRMMLMGGLMWMGTGIFVMKKMVSFKI